MDKKKKKKKSHMGQEITIFGQKLLKVQCGVGTVQAHCHGGQTNLLKRGTNFAKTCFVCKSSYKIR